jgi:hypothetical protein
VSGADAWLAAPVLVPLVAAMLLVPITTRWPLARAVSLASVVAQLAVAVALVRVAAEGTVLVHRFGDWPVPFGIVFVADRLAALMLALTAALALPALAHAVRGEDREGAYFHTLFQLQLAGLNGAFLTGDLFTLFVFFEVLLIASYCLLVHGATPARVRWGMHYVVLNLVGSTLFLVAAGVLYGLLGTLNLAELARRVAALAPEDVAPVRVAALLLLTVFALKAALAPLHLWLPGTYAAAGASVAALFAIMTKVGVYAVLRVFGVVFGPGSRPARRDRGALALPCGARHRHARRDRGVRPPADGRRARAPPGGVAARGVRRHPRRLGGRLRPGRRRGGSLLPRAQHARRRRDVPRRGTRRPGRHGAGRSGAWQAALRGCGRRDVRRMRDRRGRPPAALRVRREGDDPGRRSGGWRRCVAVDGGARVQPARRAGARAHRKRAVLGAPPRRGARVRTRCPRPPCSPRSWRSPRSRSRRSGTAPRRRAAPGASPPPRGGTRPPCSPRRGDDDHRARTACSPAPPSAGTAPRGVGARVQPRHAARAARGRRGGRRDPARAPRGSGPSTRRGSGTAPPRVRRRVPVGRARRERARRRAGARPLRAAAPRVLRRAARREDPYVTAVLAAVISLTPGTVSADYDAEAHTLLVHGLDVGDPAAEAARIKARYERALREVFSC